MNTFNPAPYANRAEKSRYVWDKYQAILRGQRILDVGADECHLKQHLDAATTYWGIGLGGNPDQRVDLDREPLPHADGEFDVVLCLDVLEHLEDIHRVFDEVCRVAGRHVILSLPNCLGHLWRILTRFGRETDEGLMKFYGLPPEPPPDRHRWFFDSLEAEQFVRHRAARNNMAVVQLDWQKATTRPMLRKRFLLAVARRILLRGDVEPERLDRGTLWAVLERQGG